MQPLTDGPRLRLTRAQVKALLQSQSTIQIEFGATALDGDFSEVADISNWMQPGSSIICDAGATIHRTCSLEIDSDVTDTGWSYLSGFVRPYQRITDVATGLFADFYLGVYTLTTPTNSIAAGGPGVQNFQGYDLNYLLAQEIGDSYEVLSGTDPAQAAADAIGLAIPEVEILVTPSGSTLPNSLTWAFDPGTPVTYLNVVQTLLASIGYREVWVDWNGVFRVEPFIDLQESDYEWTFDTADSDNIVAEDATQDIDIYDVPNWWRFVMADQAATPVEGVSMFTYTDTNPGNPGSTVNRGRIIRHIEAVSVTSFADLQSYGQRVISDSLNPAETFSVHTQPFPLAWHLDVIHFLDDELASTRPLTASGERRVVSVAWTLPLDGQSDMEWTWQTITDQTVTLGLTVIEA